VVRECEHDYHAARDHQYEVSDHAEDDGMLFAEVLGQHSFRFPDLVDGLATGALVVVRRDDVQLEAVAVHYGVAEAGINQFIIVVDQEALLLR
jgi:hypothetical protein